MVADIWQWTPLMFLILLAGLVGVPEDQIKAATLLGANAWQRFTTIVLPKMKTIIVIALAIRVIENFKIFDTLYIMTGGGPGVATETISVYIYKVTTQDLIWGYVAAIALAILVVLSIVAVFAMKRMAAPARTLHELDPPPQPGQEIRRLHGAEDHGPRDRRRRVHGAARPLGLRQVDDHEHDRRHGGTDRRAHPVRRAATWPACRWAGAASASSSRTTRSSPI